MDQSQQLRMDRHGGLVVQYYLGIPIVALDQSKAFGCRGPALSLVFVRHLRRPIATA